MCKALTTARRTAWRIVVAATALSAAGCASSYLVRGEGGAPCATVVRQVQSSNQARMQYSAWLSGYVTRYNYERDAKLSRDFESGTLIDAAVQYCQGKPLDDFSEAAEAVIAELKKKQGN